MHPSKLDNRFSNVEISSMDLREFRKALDLTIEAAAVAAGIAPTTWWRIETRSKVPLATHVEKIRLWVAHQRKVKRLPKGWDVDWAYLAAEPVKKAVSRRRR